MYYAIYQIPNNKIETCPWAFCPYRFAKENGMQVEHDYEKVYNSLIDQHDFEDCDDLQIAMLEHIFSTFQDNRTINWARSLSVSDVVQLGKDYFYCNPVGWEKIPDAEQQITK